MSEVLESKIGKNPVVMEKIAELLPAKNLLMLRLTCKMWNQKFIPKIRMKHTPLSLTPQGSHNFGTMSEVLESKIGKNPVVMEKIAELLPAKNLLMLRLTCKMWNQKFIPKIRMKHAPLSLTPQGYQYGINQRLECYTETMQIRQNLPFTKYTIRFVGGSEQIQNSNFQKFLTKFGGTITRLVLSWTSYNQFTPTELRNLVFEQVPFLVSLKLVMYGLEGPEEDTPNTSFAKPIPNLKKIDVFSTNRIWTSFIRLLADIVQRAPHLESVKLRDNSSLPVLTAIKDSVADLHKLNTLKLATTSVTWLKLLVELGGRSTNGLKLEKFSTTIQYNWSGGEQQQDALIANANPMDIREASQLLYRFLVTQSGTLQKLEIQLRHAQSGILGLGRSRPGVPFHFPLLEHLHTFGLNTNGAQLAYDGISFAGNFPKLRRFEFCYLPTTRSRAADQYYWTSLEDEVSRLFHVGVTELHLYLSHPEQLAKWPCIFPSVTQLILWEVFVFRSGHVRDNANCWTLWPKLVKLNNNIRPAAMEEPSRL